MNTFICCSFLTCKFNLFCSHEKGIQHEREKSVLFSIYPSPEFIPDSPAEPDPEPYDLIPPKIIPTEDVSVHVIINSKYLTLLLTISFCLQLVLFWSSY